MGDKINRGVAVSYFFSKFAEEGVTEIPYDHNKLHAAFYEASNVDAETSERMILVKRANPYCGALAGAWPMMVEAGMITVDDVFFPTKIILNPKRQNRILPGKESELAQRAHDNYRALVMS